MVFFDIIAEKHHYCYTKIYKTMELLAFTAKLILLIIDCATYAMLGRMLLPFFVNPEESILYSIAFSISEPFITPTRFVLVKLNAFQKTPIDMAFFISYLIINLLRTFLPAL